MRADAKDSEYSTINFAIESGPPSDSQDVKDTMRGPYRRNRYFLRCSMLLNIAFLVVVIMLSSIIHHRRDDNDSDGDESASATATCTTGQCLREKCNGNGIYDPLLQKCNCYECYSGEYCTVDVSYSVEACSAVDVTAGDPKLFENYWLTDGPSKAALMEISPVWGMSYSGKDVEALVQEDIRALHKLVGNIQIRESDFIIVGSGSTHLLSAILYAAATIIAETAPDTAAPNVYAEIPYYNAYSDIATYHNSKLLGEFNPETSPGVNDSAIEIVTAPNNPTGENREPLYDNSFVLYDRAYNWPHFMPMDSTPVQVGDSEVTLYTLSKMSGHAGSRIGWAVVKDEVLAKAIQKYIAISVVSIPHEPLWRAHAVLDHIVTSEGEIFGYAKDILEYRWGIMKYIFEKENKDNRFDYSPEYSSENAELCDFFGTEQTPTKAYVWIKCNNEADQLYTSTTDSSRVGCDGVFLDAGINGRGGRVYGMSDDSYIRLELLMNDRTFELLHQRLNDLFFNIGPSR